MNCRDTSGKRNPSWKGGGDSTCPQCGGPKSRSYKNYPVTLCAKCRGYTGKNWWEMSDQIKKRVHQSWHKKPTTPEKIVSQIIKLNNLPYKYVGDGGFILGGYCPDFLNTNGQKKVIEVYGDYWHRNDDPQQRIDYFSKFGFKILIIWESELKNIKIASQKICTFEEEE